MRSAGLRESSAHWEGQVVDADVVSSLAIHGLKRFGLTTPKTPKTAGDWGGQTALRATNLLSSQTMMTHYRDSSVRIALACGLIAQPFSFVT